MPSTAENAGGMIMLVVGVTVAILVLVFVNLFAGQTYQATEPLIEEVGDTEIVNATFALVSDENASLGVTDIHPGTFTLYSNETAEVASEDYTLYPKEGYLLYTASVLNQSNGNVSYHYGDDSIKHNIRGSVTSSLESSESIGGFIPIVLIVLVIVFVMGAFMLPSMMRSGGMGGGGAL